MVEGARVVNQVRGRADVLADFRESHRVAAVLAADDKHDVALWRDLAHGVLAIGRRVAEVAAGQPLAVGRARQLFLRRQTG